MELPSIFSYFSNQGIWKEDLVGDFALVCLTLHQNPISTISLGYLHDPTTKNPSNLSTNRHLRDY